MTKDTIPPPAFPSSTLSVAREIKRLPYPDAMELARHLSIALPADAPSISECAEILDRVADDVLAAK